MSDPVQKKGSNRRFVLFTTLAAALAAIGGAARRQKMKGKPRKSPNGTQNAGL
jgi:hypothetical protein